MVKVARFRVSFSVGEWVDIKTEHLSADLRIDGMFRAGWFLVVCFVGCRASGGFPKFPTNVCGTRNVHWYPVRDPRVVGGEIPPRGAIPWQVELRINHNHHCGGAVISERLVLTAAHCLTVEGLLVVAGVHGKDRDPHEQIVRIETVVKHPEFRRSGPYSHDIALIVLKSPGLKLGSYVQPACLPHESPPAGTWCEVSGWGASNPDRPDNLSPILRSAAVPLLSLETCRRDGVYGGRQQEILDTMLCAGHLRGGIDACGGDSGGPLVCERDGRLELTGIVSWGDGCAKTNRPGVYTRVASYVSWIRETANDLGIDYN